MNGRTVQLDLRAVLPVAVLALIVLIIVIAELCGREDVQVTETVVGPTAVPGPTFTPGPTPTEDPALAAGGDERDATRQADMAAVQEALEEFRADTDNYPNTDGNIQTLCVFEGVDIACSLQDYLDPLPNDPLGEPAANGYFYQSDGSTYVIYAIREGEAVPACDEHPDHLAGFDSVMCVRSGEASAQ